jgi:uncharacterized SAM-binding protein YcdF (DUF218 family)
MSLRWIVKNAVGGLFLFPCNCLLLLAVGWMLRRRSPRLAKVLAVGGFVGLAALSTTGLAVQLINRVELEVPPLDFEDPGLAHRADAIVVLGAGRTTEAQEYSRRDIVSPSGFLRLRYGAELARKTGKPILLTGGSPERPGKSEAALMAEALKSDLGLEARWLEEKSTNTFENAQFSFAILSKAGIRRVFLVTHASHMARALRSFKKAGFEVVPAPMGYMSDRGGEGSILSWIPSELGVEMSSIYFHETIGSVWYWLTGAS